MLASEHPAGTGGQEGAAAAADEVQRLLDEVEEAVAALRNDARDIGAIQTLLHASTLMLAERMLEGDAPRPFPASRTPNATALALTIGALMEAGDIDIPQLAMWQALGFGVGGEGSPASASA